MAAIGRLQSFIRLKFNVDQCLLPANRRHWLAAINPALSRVCSTGKLFRLVISQIETEIKISNTLMVKGKKVPNAETYVLDGEKKEEIIPVNTESEAKRITKASLKKNKIKIEVTTINPQGRKFKTTREFELSKGGNTLTVKASSQTPFLLSNEKMVYDKQ